MFDAKGGSRIRGGFNVTRIVRSLLHVPNAHASVTLRCQVRLENPELRGKYRDAVSGVTSTPNHFTHQ
jgi:hypothetical protein